jgi:hypothetical protein
MSCCVLWHEEASGVALAAGSDFVMNKFWPDSMLHKLFLLCHLHFHECFGCMRASLVVAVVGLHN